MGTIALTDLEMHLHCNIGSAKSHGVLAVDPDLLLLSDLPLQPLAGELPRARRT